MRVHTRVSRNRCRFGTPQSLPLRKQGSWVCTRLRIKGIAKKIPDFDEYAFAKYNRSKKVKLRDVFML